MRKLSIALLVATYGICFAAGCAVSGGGTSGTGLEQMPSLEDSQDCPTGKTECCPKDVECAH